MVKPINAQNFIDDVKNNNQTKLSTAGNLVLNGIGIGVGNNNSKSKSTNKNTTTPKVNNIPTISK